MSDIAITQEALAFPLSFAQQRLWLIEQLMPGTPTYNVVMALRMTGALDVVALHASLNDLVRRHETLRTRFATTDGQPLQVIVAEQPLGLPVYVIDALPKQEHDAAEDGLIRAEARRLFDLACGPLFRTLLLRRSLTAHMLLLSLHHSVADAWSLGVLVRELAALYSAHRTGQPAALPPLPVQYADFTLWQREQLQGAVLAAHLAYWKGQLAELPALELPSDHPRPPVQRGHGARLRTSFPPALLGALRALAQQQHSTLFMLLLAAFAALLARYSGQHDLAIGAPIANRTRAELKDVIGFFVNTLVLRVRLSETMTVQELLAQVRTLTLEAYAHQDLPFEQLVEVLHPQRDLSRTPLVQVMLVLQNTAPIVLDLPGLHIQEMPVDNDTSKFDLTLTLEEKGDELAVVAEYSTDLFAASTIARLLGHFQTLLTALPSDLAAPVARLPLLTRAEHAQLAAWNATQQPFALPSDLAAALAEQAARSPDAVALVFASPTTMSRGQGSGVRGQETTAPLPPPAGGGTEGGRAGHSSVLSPQSLTYHELHRRASLLAHFLRARGVGPDVRVGIALDRSLELLIALLATLQAGGAFVPLDPSYPAERLAFMLEDAQAAVLITTTDAEPRTKNQEPHASENQLPGADDELKTQNSKLKTHSLTPSPLHPFTLSPCHLVSLSESWSAIARCAANDPVGAPDPDNLAYLLYTSGSTGTPKGAMNSHRAVLNRLAWMQLAFALAPADRVLHKTPISFDVSVWELFWPLLTGATLVLARPGGHADPPYLRDLIAAERISTLHFVPAMLQHFLEVPQLDRCSSLTRIICSGEALPLELAQRCTERLSAQLFNLYGPTEAAIDVTAWEYRAELSAHSVPIGQPIANTQIYLLDRHMQPVPVGVAGELYIGGVQLARGYHRRPDLTAAAFVPNPFAQVLGDGCWVLEDATPNTRHPTPITRLYRTGDLARYREDGAIEYLGRLDDQVKVRGVRIELGEVEALLMQHEQVRGCAVAARAEGAGEVRLVAYVVPKIEDRGLKIEDSGSSAREPLSSIFYPLSSELRDFLKDKLPDYMVPATFVQLEALPLTPSGKVDRKALPSPGTARIQREAIVAPRDTIELQLVQIWESLLRVHPIGVKDNFFALGGHSLLAMRLVTQIQKQFNLALPLSILFQEGTIEQLAARLHPHALDLPRSPAVHIQPVGTRRPFFCVHPIGGHVLCYVELARHLGLDQPFYGLQSPGLESESVLDTGIEDMAARYIAALRAVHPKGPFMLGGWSFGGIVAFEMAQQLRRQGEEIALLALIDTYLPAPGRQADGFSESETVADFARYLRNMFGLSIADAELHALAPDRQLPYILEQAQRAEIFPPGAELSYLYQLLEVFKAYTLALHTYQARPYPQPITYFRACEPIVEGLPDPLIDWQAMACGGIKVHMVPGDHITMIKAPHVQELAQLLNAEMSLAERCIQASKSNA